MPIFTVTVKNDATGEEKTVTVNTDDMKATVLKPETEKMPLAEEPLAEEPLATEPLAEEPLATEPLATEPLAEKQTNTTSNIRGGKRSAPSFRLKKRRITRKLRKTR